MGKNNQITHRSACLNDTLLVEPGSLESRSNQWWCGLLHLYVLDQRLSLSLCKKVYRGEQCWHDRRHWRRQSTSTFHSSRSNRDPLSGKSLKTWIAWLCHYLITNCNAGLADKLATSFAGAEGNFNLQSQPAFPNFRYTFWNWTEPNKYYVNSVCF